MKIFTKTCIVVFMMMLFSFSGYSQSVFINELHYDNSGADVNEGVEIAAPAGTDLAGWSLVLYNGNGGSAYSTSNISGIVTDQQAGYGTIFFAITGIQNGSPDGIALVDPANNVVQFLSYEGVFSAVGGPADTQASTDIGMAEASSTPVGSSLQLTGVGTEYGDFTWQLLTTSSYDGVNTGQTFLANAEAPIINEFVFNHTGSDTDEFVEIKSTSEEDLSSYWILEIEGDGAGAGTIDEAIQAGIADDLGYWTTGYLSNAFENGTVSLLLVKDFFGATGDDIDTDNDGVIDTVFWAEVIDDIAVNDGGAGDINYASVTLIQGFDGSSFTVGGASRIPDGQDTDTDADWTRNDFDGSGLPSFPGAIAEPGEALNTMGLANKQRDAPLATILINEIDSDTPGTDNAEFIELYDGGLGNSPLDGLTIVLYNGSNNLSYSAFDLDGFATDANGYFLLGNTSIANVGIILSSNGLQNGADAVALYQGDAADFPSGTPITTTDLLDAIVYDTNDSDDAELLALLNLSQPQVNEAGQGDKDNHSLQRYTNGSGGLRNTDSYVAALPTPGASNTNNTEPVMVIINEVDADTPGSDTAEFIELYDGGSGNTALDGLVVVLYNGNNDVSYNAFDLDGFSTNAAGYFVLGNSGVDNVSLTFPSNGLQNGADAVALYQGDGTDFPSGTVVTTVNLVDALVYDTNDSDDAGLLILLNSGEQQVNEDEGGDKDNESLQRIPNGDGGVRNTSTYRTEAPTPGVENGGGIVTPTDPVTIAEARAQPEGTTVTILGVLTVADNFAGAAYIQDATGGIAIFDAQVHGDGLFQIGDSIKITAVRSSFNEQIQLSSVSSVESFGPTTTPVVPRVVGLEELGNYPGELVTVSNVSFPSQNNNLLFGNSNYTLTDANGTGQLRIDNDVDDLVGLAQPDSCTEVTGVVGRFLSTYQLLPRMRSDLPCAEEYESGGDDLSIPKEKTFDVVTWNIEWFGDENNSPAAGSPDSDSIQKDSVKSVLLDMDADIIAVQEITDTTLFSQMISEIPGYKFILSDFVSRPNSGGAKQHVGFIYKDAVVAPDISASKGLLASIHPLYNGGDASSLAGYPDSPDRFWASGRLPYLLVADITVQEVTKKMHLVVLHSRANSSRDAQARYDMRTYDVEVLKDTLDTYYADANLIVLGDYNDDLDVTVADISTTTTSYDAYVSDSSYLPLTLALSQEGFRSFVSRENMIDHIVASEQLEEAFVTGSARVGYEFYDNDYSRTASDHMPVSVRFLLEEEVTFNDFQAVEVVSFNQGRRKNGWPVHWYRSIPERALGRPLENYYFNFVSLGFGGEITLKLDNYMYDLPGDEFKVFESTFGNFNIPCHWYPEEAEVFASGDGRDFISLGTTCLDGRFDLAVSRLKKAQYIKVVDISDRSNFSGWADGYDLDGIYNLIHEGSVKKGANVRSDSFVPEDRGSLVPNEDVPLEISAYPNPFGSHLTLDINVANDMNVNIQIIDMAGKIRYSKALSLHFGAQQKVMDLNTLAGGMYFLKLGNKEGIAHTIKIVKE